MAKTDEFYLTQTLKLAAKAAGRTFPNPMVGAVIVKNGRVLGQGYHLRAGQPHAEIAALRSAGKALAGATLYVNLEPCCHFGRTPPCVDAILAAGIVKVVCATLDPNPQVGGQGVKKLRQAGISVKVGVKAEAARKLNEAFFTFHEKRRPFIAIKFAASLDGKIATKTFHSRWITNESARGFARGLRGQYQAVLVGINTVLRDNPHLGTREKGRLDPLRIILDSQLKMPLSSKVLRDNRVLLVAASKASAKKRRLLAKRGIDLAICPANKIALSWLMKELYRREIVSVLVEGGGQVLGSFVDAQLVDKVYCFYAPIILGGQKAVSAVGGEGATTVKKSLKLKNVTFKKFGDNILTAGYAIINKPVSSGWSQA